ncbi:MAG: hypothetical protein ACQEQS_06450 [Thermodesulfobacteriota bacterium]
MKYSKIIVLIFITALSLNGCSSKELKTENDTKLLFRASDNETLLSDFSPLIYSEKANKNYNLIGSPVAEKDEDGKIRISIDTEKPCFFAEKREFKTKKDNYLNLIYRVNFTETPGGHLGKGKNVGLFFIITLNSDKKPVLFSAVHTCGCYLAFVPTSLLPESAYPENWPEKMQSVHGEKLPSILEYKGDPEKFKILVHKKSANHRVSDVKLISKSKVDSLFKTKNSCIKSLDSLENLSISENEKTSFFITEKGASKGYVKNSKKIYERMFMSWWTFDWRIGQDKKLGKNKNEGSVFYTSIKPWARDESDMRDFKTFLEYWGWDL